MWYGGGLVGLSQTSVTLGTIFLFIQLSQMLFRPLRQIADKFNTLQMGMVAANRVFKILDTSDFIVDNGENNPKKIQGKVSFKNIYFSYDSKNPVFKNFSLDISSGEKVAIVGSTGCPKQSINMKVFEFYFTKSNF